ncbi:MAG: hypothetical protein ACRD1X_01610 [Vicinamibacteria bacterium]
MPRKIERPSIDFWTWLSLRATAKGFGFELPVTIFGMDQPQIMPGNTGRIGLILMASQTDVYSFNFATTGNIGTGMVVWPIEYPGPPNTSFTPFILTARDIGTTITQPIFGGANAATTFFIGYEVSVDFDWVELYEMWFGPIALPIGSTKRGGFKASKRPFPFARPEALK